jgi:hypothetical protein
MKYYILFLLLLLEGCAVPSRPTVVTNKVAIAAPCPTATPEDSTLPLDTAKPEDGLFSNVKSTLATVEILKGDLEKYKAAFKSCK